jgi:AraC-like DNA-binding protein
MQVSRQSITYAMQQRSDRPDFYIRSQSERPPLMQPHRHDYFQIQLNLGGDSVQHIGGAIRPFARRTLAFIQPHRLHFIPHPVDGQFVVINIACNFLLPHLNCEPLDLDDIPLAQAAELTLFRFQEFIDFVLDEEDFQQILLLVEQMKACDKTRQFGAELRLRGYLLQLLGLVCGRYQQPLQALADNNAEKRGQKAALKRTLGYVRQHIADAQLSLSEAAAAAFISPNYLTHLLRKSIGKTFSELVFEQRMRLARHKLLTSLDPISQVAQDCGYPDDAYFSRRFRQAHGLPPGKFRQQALR